MKRGLARGAREDVRALQTARLGLEDRHDFAKSAFLLLREEPNPVLLAKELDGAYGVLASARLCGIHSTIEIGARWWKARGTALFLRGERLEQANRVAFKGNRAGCQIQQPKSRFHTTDFVLSSLAVSE